MKYFERSQVQTGAGIFSRLAVLGSALLTLASVQVASGQDNQSPLVRSMGITQNLGQFVPKDVPFKDESGKTVKFGDMLQGRPIVLVPIFYACQTGCPVLTDQIIKTLAKANKGSDKMVVGRDLDVLMLSIHPKETPELAQSKKAFLLQAFEPPNATKAWRETTGKGWHLLTGDLASIKKVTDAIGFKYGYNAEKNLINHPTCTVILTPQGQVSGYTIGNDFPTRVVEDELALASQNKVGDRVDQSMMFGCIMLDPLTHKYRVVLENVLRLLCVVTLIVLAAWIGGMVIKERRQGTRPLSPLEDPEGPGFGVTR